MTLTIEVNGTEHQAFKWTEATPVLGQGDVSEPKHSRNEALLSEGVSQMAPGEVYFLCDQTLLFDTTFSLKADGRKFVVIASGNGYHVAKPY